MKPQKEKLVSKLPKIMIIAGMIAVFFVALAAPVVGVIRMDSASGMYLFLPDWTLNAADYSETGTFRSHPVLGDLDGDGALEIVIGLSDGIVLGLESNGRDLLWSTSIDDGIRIQPALGDLNGDGLLDVVVSSDQEVVYAINGANRNELWNFSASPNAYEICAPAVGDVNGDALLDVVFGDSDGNIYAINGVNGNQLWSRNLIGDVRVRAVFGDLNEDGINDVIVGLNTKDIYALDGTDGSQLWNYETTEYITSPPLVGDLNNDSILEVLIGDNGPNDEGNIYAFDRLGTKLWNFSTNGGIDSSPILGDLNGNGYNEVVVGCDTENYGFLHVIRGFDGHEVWNFSTSKPITASPVIEALEGDNNRDIIFRTGEQFKTGGLYALDGTNGHLLSSYSLDGEGIISLTSNNIDGDNKLEFIVLNGEFALSQLEFRLGPRAYVYQEIQLMVGTLIGCMIALFILFGLFYWNERQKSHRSEIISQIDKIESTKSARNTSLKAVETRIPNIETDNLTKIYKNNVVAVDSINLLVQNGIHGFLGPNGAGKTTTMKMLTGAISITKGDAKIKGYEAGSLQAKKRIGYMPQRSSFYEEMTGREYLIHSAKLARIETQKAYQLAEEMLTRFKLGDAADRKVDTYSGGMQQKIGLAASFIASPEILLLDEPTSDLDPIWRNRIISYIKHFSKETSIFVSSHILPEIEMMCDTVTIINEGKIVLTDTVENLKTLYEDGAYRFIINTSDNERVYSMLHGKPFIEHLQLDPEVDVLKVVSSDVSKMDQFISEVVAQNIALKKYTREETSLNDIFLQLIEGEEEEKLK